MKWRITLFLLFVLGILIQCHGEKQELAPLPTLEIGHLSSPQQAMIHQAVAGIQNASQQEPQIQAQAWAELARCLHAFDLRQQAMDAYRNAVQLLPGTASYSYLQGHLLQEMGHLEEAMASFQNTAQLEPTYIPNLLAIGELQRQNADYEAAAKAFNQVLSLDEKNVMATASLATLALDQKEYERALNWAQKGLAQAPQVKQLHDLAAIALRHLGQVEASERATEQSRNVAGKMPMSDPYLWEVQRMTQRDQILVDEALEAVTKQQFDRAESLFKEACQWEPQSTMAHYQWARLQHQRGKYTQALETINQAIAVNPKQAPNHQEKAQILARMGQFESAMKEFEQAIALAPETVDPYRLAGTLARQQGWFAKAETLYQHGVQQLPNDWHLQMGLVICLLQQHKHVQAKTNLEMLLEKPGTPPSFFLMLARLLAASPEAEVRNGARAAQIVESLVKTGVYIDLLETGAMAMAEIGDFAKAKEWQDGAIQLLGQSLQRKDLSRLRKRMALYEANQPCREPFEPNDPLFTKPF